MHENTLVFGPLGNEEDNQLIVPQDLPAALLMLREAMLDGQNGSARHRHSLFDGLTDPDGVARQRDAMQQVERLLYEQVVRPMIDEAMAASGGTERAVRLAISQLLQMYLTQGTVINAQIVEAMSGKRMDDLDNFPLEGIKEFLGNSDSITKLIREADRCH